MQVQLIMQEITIFPIVGLSQLTDWQLIDKQQKVESQVMFFAKL